MYAALLCCARGAASAYLAPAPPAARRFIARHASSSSPDAASPPAGALSTIVSKPASVGGSPSERAKTMPMNKEQIEFHRRALPKDTGGLSRLPMPTPADELMNRGKRKSLFLVRKPPPGLQKPGRSRKESAQKLSSLRVDAITNEIAPPLRKVRYCGAVRRPAAAAPPPTLTAPKLSQLLRARESALRRLHPFERALADLTLRRRSRDGDPPIEDVVDGVNGMR